MEVTVTRSILLLAPLLAGCLTGSHCVAFTKEACDVCPKNDFNTAVCKCLQEGTLAKDDFSDGEQLALGIETDADAAQACDRWTIQTSIPGPEEDAQCHQDLAYLKDYQADVCEDLGWSSD